MKILQKLMMLTLVSVFLPGVAFAHPDMSNRKDVQRILYAAFLDAFYEGNNELEQKFHDRRTYSVNITSNKLFVKELNTDAQKVVVQRFPDFQTLITLWTLQGAYKPKFKPFTELLEVLEEAVEDEKFLVKKAVALAKDSKAFDPESYTTLYTDLFGHADGDDALLATDLTTLGNALIADINARKKSKEINKAYVNDVDHLFDGKNSEAKMKKAHLPDMQRNRYIQHYTLNVDKADLTTFSLTDAGIKVTPELGDTVPTTDNGGQTGESPNSDGALAFVTQAGAIIVDTAQFAASIEAAATIQDAAAKALALQDISIKLTNAIGLYNNARNNAQLAINASEPKAGEARTAVNTLGGDLNSLVTLFNQVQDDSNLDIDFAHTDL